MRINKDIEKKIIINIIVMAMIASCLCITIYAATRKSVYSNGVFQTGEVKININDGLPIINDDEFLFEPGMIVEKKFFVKNEGTCDVYFKVYFENVSGPLADILNIKVLDGESVLFDGTPQKFTDHNAAVVANTLKENEKKDLKILIHYPKLSNNSGKGFELTFDLCAKAVQVKNNPSKELE